MLSRDYSFGWKWRKEYQVFSSSGEGWYAFFSLQLSFLWLLSDSPL